MKCTSWISENSETPQRGKKRKRGLYPAETEEALNDLLNSIGTANLPHVPTGRDSQPSISSTMHGFLHPLLIQRIVSQIVYVANPMTGLG